MAAAPRGLAGLLLLTAVPAGGQNLLTNPAFDHDIAGYAVSPAGAWSAIDAHDDPASGSLRQVIAAGQGYALQNVKTLTAESYHLRGGFYVPQGSGTGKVGVATFYYGNTLCDPPSIGSSEAFVTITPGVWQTLDTYAHAKPSGTACATAQVSAVAAIGPLIVYYDDLVFEPSSQAGCHSDANALCLGDGRFRVTATWKTAEDVAGGAHAVELTPDTGYLWFFNASNVEAIVKVLDGCALNGHYWVFAGGLTDVKTDIVVRDLRTGASKTYSNPQGKAFRPVQDTSAFACP
jgi:hypothetical protein